MRHGDYDYLAFAEWRLAMRLVVTVGMTVREFTTYHLHLDYGKPLIIHVLLYGVRAELRGDG